jgi:hypothetical protein
VIWLAAILLAVVALVVWRPAVAVIGLGVFLFAQSAIIRLDGLPPQLTHAASRADEIVLLALVVRTTAALVLQRRIPLPRPLWALGAFTAVGVMSAAVNGVEPLQAAVGLFLAIKAGLWLYVGRFLRVNDQAIVRYGYIIGSLFLGTVVIAVLQFAGVTMPWDPHVRHSGALAATSIWNQHTAFGTALAVGVGLAVAGLRLPGERMGASILAFANAIGIVLSSVRRLLLSLPASAIVTVWALPTGERHALLGSARVVRRPVVLASIAAGLALVAILAGPRFIQIADDTWNQYVVDITTRDRFRLYEGAVQLVENSPLLGRGPATYGSYASVIFDSPAYAEVGFDRPDKVKMAAPYGSLIAEYGLLGVLSFAAFVALLFGALLPIARSGIGTVPAALAAAGIFMLVDMVIESVVNPVFSNSFVTFFVFVGIGAAMSLGASDREPAATVWDPNAIERRWRIGAVPGAFLFLGALAVVAVLLRWR